MPESRREHIRPSRRLWVLYAAYVALLGAASFAGLAWWLTGRLPATQADPDVVWRYYYPELRRSGVLSASPASFEEHFDVLLLGGSVLEQLSPALTDAFQSATHGRARVFNLARAAHTTRDSRNKWLRVGDRPFDLVIVYHGINDARMNCCPPESFRNDYRHCVWYDSFEERLPRGRLAVGDVLRDRVGQIGLGEPSPDLLDFGRTLKTPPAFRSNLAEIAESLKHRRPPQTDRLLLATFAYFIPPNYTHEDFDAGRLGYGTGRYQPYAAKLWGHPDAVAAAIDAHNAVTRKLASEYGTLFLDLAETLPATGENFVDPCHLTDTACLRVAEQFVAAARPSLERFQTRPP